VTNTWSPKTTGELVPQPGNVTDQRTFSVLLQRVGRSRLSATPSAFGPRQHGQSVAGCWADAKDADKTSVTTRIEVGFMNYLSAAGPFGTGQATLDLGLVNGIVVSNPPATIYST
jgi:hypothetical protein